jgi:hypothetical protein
VQHWALAEINSSQFEEQKTPIESANANLFEDKLFILIVQVRAQFMAQSDHRRSQYAETSTSFIAEYVDSYIVAAINPPFAGTSIIQIVLPN